MATFKSEEVRLHGSAEQVYSRLSNLEGLKDLLANMPKDQIPEDKLQLLDQVEITSDTISIPGGPVGALKLRITQKTEPTLLRLEGEGTPVALSMQMEITPVDEHTSLGCVEIDLAIPAMMRPMVSGPLNKATAEIGRMLSMLNFAG